MPSWLNDAKESNVFFMKALRTVIVFDAADLDSESAFWTSMLNGYVLKESNRHSVIDESGEWRIGIQLNPTHVKPEWPNGKQQQIHLDIHIQDPYKPERRTFSNGLPFASSSTNLSK